MTSVTNKLLTSPHFHLRHPCGHSSSVLIISLGFSD